MKKHTDVQQRQLFDPRPDPWELDDLGDRLVAEVVFPEGVAGSYDYLVPEALRGSLMAGKRVRVPLGRGDRPTLGYCVRTGPAPADGRRLKSVQAVLDEQALLSSTMLDLTRWMSEHYLCPWGKVLETVVPAAVRGGAGTRQETRYRLADHARSRPSELTLPPKQAAVVQMLLGEAGPRTAPEIRSRVGCTMAPIRSLREKGLVEVDRHRVMPSPTTESPGLADTRVELNRDQQAAVREARAAIAAGHPQTLLLHGVTGSGKTEVYMRAIDEAIRYGRQAIVLVPEISLTPQTLSRFRARFRHVCVLHSHLSDVQRHAHWQQIAAGQVQVVVGARSAVFAPTPQLGILVLDEEHDGSFKQDQVPRYHAREVALQRAVREQVPLILGSATPSLESWHSAQTGRFRLLQLPYRVADRPLPQVTVVDLRDEFASRRFRGALSHPLCESIQDAVQTGGQVILLLNRRGFSTHIQCPSCGEVVRCQNCDIALTHHREQEQVICHYCEFQRPSPTHCPNCRFEGIRYGGLGTQRLEAEVQSRFPRVTCLRMDSDAMRKPGSHEQALARFRRGEVQILLGTQMIAKGLDFPQVTLVGVINADTGLHLPDFRAAERTFQLVTQVAGRTGRGARGGRVLLQTFNPEHYAITAAARHDFAKFVRRELDTRREFGYPPFGALLRIIVRGPSESQARQFIEQVADCLAGQRGDPAAFRVVGPAPAPMARLRGNFRFHLLLQADSLPPLQAAVRQVQQTLAAPASVQWQADVEPLDML